MRNSPRSASLLAASVLMAATPAFAAGKGKTAPAQSAAKPTPFAECMQQLRTAEAFADLGLDAIDDAKPQDCNSASRFERQGYENLQRAEALSACEGATTVGNEDQVTHIRGRFETVRGKLRKIVDSISTTCPQFELVDECLERLASIEKKVAAAIAALGKGDAYECENSAVLLNAAQSSTFNAETVCVESISSSNSAGPELAGRMAAAKATVKDAIARRAAKGCTSVVVDHVDGGTGIVGKVRSVIGQ